MVNGNQSGVMINPNRLVGSVARVLANFPKELLQLPNWVVSEVTFNAEKSLKAGYAKFDKIPKALNGMTGAKSNDPSTWHRIEEVAAACKRLQSKPPNHLSDQRVLYLPGFMIGGTDYTGLDFDHCILGKGIDSQVAAIVRRFPGAYFEMTVGGGGLRGFLKGKKPVGVGSHYQLDQLAAGVTLEIYDAGRFFVCTGHGPSGVVLQDCQNVLHALCAELSQPIAKARVDAAPPDPEELAKIRSALQTLPFDTYFGEGCYDNWLRVRFALQSRFLHQREHGITLMDEVSSGRLHGVPAPRSYQGYKDIEKRWDDHNTAKHTQPITLGWLFHQAQQYSWNAAATRGEMLTRLRQSQPPVSAAEDLSAFTSTVLPEPIAKYSDLWHGWLLGKAFCTESRFILETGDAGVWSSWNGKYWEDGQVRFRMKAAHALPNLVGQAGGKKKHIVACSSTFRINNAITEARAHCHSASREFNTNPLLFNVSNGTLNLQTGEFSAHRRTDRIRGVCAEHLVYDPMATCPQFDSVLWHALSQYDDQGLLNKAVTTDLIDYFWRVGGYFLTDYTSEKCFWLFIGLADTGKSLIDNVLNGILGKYAAKGNIDFIKRNRNDKHSAVDHQLVGLRKVTFTEARRNERLDEEKLKAYTGEKRAMTRGMCQNYGEYPITAKIVIASNFGFVYDSRDTAFIRRLRLIRFTNRVPEQEQIPDYDSIILAEEAAGIFNKMIAGYHDWKINGMQTPAIISQWLEEDLALLDSGRTFLAEACIKDREAFTSMTALYAFYEEYCKLTEKRPWPKEDIKDLFLNKGYREGRRNGINGFYGIQCNDHFVAKLVGSLLSKNSY